MDGDRGKIVGISGSGSYGTFVSDISHFIWREFLGQRKPIWEVRPIF